MSRAYYDGVAEYYETFRPALPERERDALAELLGRGNGRCLDVGCGTGLGALAAAELGWSVVGVDVSRDQLAVAQSRGLAVVEAPAEALPFSDGEFDAGISLWTHTDVADFPLVLRETARVLRTGSPFVYVGGHPCFVGPHSLFVGAEGTPTLHPGYRESRRYTDAPGIGDPDGLRARVGATHVPLGTFLDAFPAAGLRLEAFRELGASDYPFQIALRCRR